MLPVVSDLYCDAQQSWQMEGLLLKEVTLVDNS